MAQVQFTSSMGELFVDPDRGWLRARLDECDEDFWESGSGDCGVTFDVDGEPRGHLGGRGSLPVHRGPGRHPELGSMPDEAPPSAG